MSLLNSWSNQYIEAGCDEVGRGCLCGPVVAAAVIIDHQFNHNLINDSKQLNFKTRIELDSYIKENVLDYSIAELSPEFIDEHNILNASIHAMHNALDQLKLKPELILVDGNKFHPYNYIPHQCIIKGDTKFLSIAAASTCWAPTSAGPVSETKKPRSTPVPRGPTSGTCEPNSWAMSGPASNRVSISTRPSSAAS